MTYWPLTISVLAVTKMLVYTQFLRLDFRSLRFRIQGRNGIDGYLRYENFDSG